MAIERFVVISGCSGGGKSSLIEELKARGYAAVDEPGRRIVREELAGDGARLPWNDMRAFAKRALDLAYEDYQSAQQLDGIVFFDRGIVDAAVALSSAGGTCNIATLFDERQFNKNVFLAPPWPEIYVQDEERRHSFDDAVSEYERLQRAYSGLGYFIHELPKIGVSERADFVLEVLLG